MGIVACSEWSRGASIFNLLIGQEVDLGFNSDGAGGRITIPTKEKCGLYSVIALKLSNSNTCPSPSPLIENVHNFGMKNCASTMVFV